MDDKPKVTAVNAMESIKEAMEPIRLMNRLIRSLQKEGYTGELRVGFEEGAIKQYWLP